MAAAAESTVTTGSEESTAIAVSEDATVTAGSEESTETAVSEDATVTTESEDASVTANSEDATVTTGSEDASVTTDSEETSGLTESSSEGDISALTLDTDILERNNNVSTSLCDRFGVHMFSDTFIDEVTSYDEKQKDEQDKILHDVLTNPKTGKTEEAFQRVMQADTVTVVKANTGEGVSQKEGSPIVYSLIGALIAGTVLFIIQKRQWKRRHENHNHGQKREDEDIV